MLKANFEKKTNKELRNIISKPDSFLPEAVLIAFELLEERGENFTEEEITLRKKLNRKVEFQIEKEEKNKLGLFSSRLFAIVIDLGVLSLLSYIIGFIFIDSDFQKYPWEPIFSFIMMMSYLTYFNSNKSKGTIGKRAMELRVVNDENERITLKKSFIRYFLLLTPFFLYLNLDKILQNTYKIDTALFWIFIFSFFYFIIKDKNLRRSYHDIISNTVVINALKNYNEPLLPKKDQIVYLSTVSIIAVFFISIGIVFSPEIPSLNGQFENSHEMISQLENDYQKFTPMAEEISDIKNVADVNEINFIEINNKERILEFVARPELFTNHDHILEEFTKVVKKNSSMLQDYDHINLKLEYNINMTLAIFHWKNLSFEVNIDFGKE